MDDSEDRLRELVIVYLEARAAEIEAAAGRLTWDNKGVVHLAHEAGARAGDLRKAAMTLERLPDIRANLVPLRGSPG